MAAKRDSAFHFEGFESPNTTPVPDVVFDVLLSRLREAELKALLYIIRRTFGFKKDRDPISFNQFLRGIKTRDGKVLDEGCGIRDRTTLSRALKSLEETGVVISEKGMDERGENVTTVYSLRFKDIKASRSQAMGPESSERAGVVGNPYHRSREYPPPVVGDSYPQETVIQETEEQEIDLSKLRRTSPLSVQDDDANHTVSGLAGDQSTAANEPAIVWEPHRRGAPKSMTERPTSIGGVLAGRVPKLGVQGNLATHRPIPDSNVGEVRVPGGAAPLIGKKGPRVEVPTQIRDLVEECARQFHDEDKLLLSNLTRAMNLFEGSGLSEYGFSRVLLEAQMATKRAGNIQKPAKEESTFPGLKNRMPYFWRVVENRLSELRLMDEGKDQQSTAPPE